MCGRFTLASSPESIEHEFGVESIPELEPRFNIAPSQDVATVDQDREGARRLVMRRWGLIPYWARDPRIGARQINARAETVDSRPSYRDAFQRRRCLVPADGFYEWGEVSRGPRQPYYLSRPDAACFGIAGLWERWRAAEGEWIESCTLLTVAANAAVRPVHDRMPAIVAPADYALWLDRDVRDPESLRRLLRPPADDALVLRPVSRRVNRPEFDDAECIAPLGPGAPA